MSLETSTSENLERDSIEVENELARDLVQFMNTNVPYTIKRLLPVDGSSMYVLEGSNAEVIEPNPFQVNFQVVPHKNKGGVRLTKYVTYNW